MRFEQLGNNLGINISDCDLRDLSEASFEEIYDHWILHSVVRFRGQHLSELDLQKFSSRLGPLEYAPHGKISKKDLQKVKSPFVTTISNIVENGRPIGGLGSSEAAWHTDMSYIENPPNASFLYAIEVPEQGGDTYFCDMYAAYDSLPVSLRKQAEQSFLKHDAAHDSVGGLRRGYEDSASPVEAPGAIHPMVRIHPETDRKVLYLGRRQDAYVVGMSLNESEEFLDEVWTYVALDEDVWTQHWEVGDAVLWDNRSVMHRRGSFSNDERRLMRRTQIKPTED